MQMPKTGSQIVLTTKHRNVRLGEGKFVFNEHSGVVLSPDKWLLPSEFAIATGRKEFPKAIINLSNVVDIKYLSGSAGNSVQSGVRNFKVTSKSTGKSYILTASGSSITCTCTGFSYRRTCKHSAKVASFLKGN
jgi:hypothetical protein